MKTKIKSMKVISKNVGLKISNGNVKNNYQLKN